MRSFSFYYFVFYIILSVRFMFNVRTLFIYEQITAREERSDHVRACYHQTPAYIQYLRVALIAAPSALLRINVGLAAAAAVELDPFYYNVDSQRFAQFGHGVQVRCNSATCS